MGNRGSVSELELDCCGVAGKDAIGEEGDVIRVRVKTKEKLGEGGFGNVYMAREVASRKMRSPKKMFSKKDSSKADRSTEEVGGSLSPRAKSATSTKRARSFACKQFVQSHWTPIGIIFICIHCLREFPGTMYSPLTSFCYSLMKFQVLLSIIISV